MNASNFEELVVWQRAMDLIIEIYALGQLLPKSEAFGLARQAQRAAVSVASNVAGEAVARSIFISSQSLAAR